MLHIPSYKLPENNLFTVRKNEMDESVIIQNVTEMLKAGEQYGVRIRNISINEKETRANVSEIKKTRSKMLTIDLIKQVGNEDPVDINFEYEIPWLVNDTHFYISGNYKVGIFQLFDKPVIIKKDFIKVKTNIQTITVEEKTSRRRKYNFIVTLFGKKFAFAKLVIAKLGTVETRKRFSLTDTNELEDNIQLSERMELLVNDIKKILNDASLDKDKLLEGEFVNRTDEKILTDLQLMLDIDTFTKRYFKTDSIVDELIYHIDDQSVGELDYTNKRLRFTEQFMYSVLCKDFYNFINTIRRGRTNKFSVNTKAILQNVNVSSVVQFDNSLNPLSELSLVSRTSLSGPGGFEKTNVPASLRDIDPSMLCRIDPCDTADREGCGTTQYLCPTVSIDDTGDIIPQSEDVINSIAVSFVPFVEHDDATRLQMSSSQQRHAIMLENFDIPMIQTGVEGMYSDNTSFIFRAKKDGSVIFMDDDIIVVKYIDNTCEAFHKGYRKLYISTVDVYNVHKEEGESFKANDIIAESNYLNDGRITLGKNLKVAVMPYYGCNYEDGIVISEKCVEEDYFTSLHYKDLVIEVPPNKVLENLNDDYQNYKPLPEKDDILNVGDVYAKIKSVDSLGFKDVIFEPASEERITDQCYVLDVKMYANKWNDKFPQFNEYITKKIDNQKKDKTELSDKLKNYLTQDQVDKVFDLLEIHKSEKNNYKIKGDSIEGIRIELTVLYKRKLKVGDKIGNRHGNKGIISSIVPHEKMPKIDGTDEHAELIINPLGIVSRMNIGQVYELHLTQSFEDLKKNVKKMHQSGESDKIVDYIIDYIRIIDKSSDSFYVKQMTEVLTKTTVDNLVDNLDKLFLIQPPFSGVDWESLNKAMEYTNTLYEYKCFDPVSNQTLQSDIAFGYQYFVKLNHIAEDKMAYRGIGPYSAKTSQPLGGKTRKGGQRLGEMELWSVISHGAEKNLDEFISTKSDSIKKRNQYISEQMGNTELLLESDDDPVPQALRLFQTSLTCIGLDYPLNDGENELVDNKLLVEDDEEDEVIVEEIKEEPELDLSNIDFGPNFGNNDKYNDKD